MAKQYVQHISGHGRKWEVIEERPAYIHEGWVLSEEWAVRAMNGSGGHLLPKSEYRLCEAPLLTEDVTADCTWTSKYIDHCKGVGHMINRVASAGAGFYFKKINVNGTPAFIIEKECE